MVIINVCIVRVEVPLLQGTSVTKLDDREVCGVAPPPPRRRVEGCAVDPNKIVSDFLNMRRSCKKLSMVELRGVGGEGYLDLGGGANP